jgi:hypothetical protein
MKSKKTKSITEKAKNSDRVVGSGRRVALKEMLKNQISNGESFVYIDGKGDVEALSKVVKKSV